MLQNLDQRVAYLEGRMENHTALMADIRAEMRELRSAIERGFERADQKTDRHFMWLVGLVLSVLAMVITVLLRLVQAGSA
jgi:ABC-type phosphate transport system permease subunit